MREIREVIINEVNKDVERNLRNEKYREIKAKEITKEEAVDFWKEVFGG